MFALYYDAILAAMYVLSFSTEGSCYLCVPPDPCIEAFALGASESALPGTAPAEALHTFTLDSGASRCFFRDSTTLTPLSAPVPVRLADPSEGPVLARSSTVLPCPVVPSGSLSGLHLPSFSTNLVSTTALQDVMVTTTTPRGLRVLICTYTRMGRHLATFTCRPGSSLHKLATEPLQIAVSAQVSASGPAATPFLCRLLSHQTLLWHHRLGHPSLPRLRGMHSRLLVFGLPRSLPPLLPSPAPPCLSCVEGRQRAAPHSSFPPMTAPLQTLHMDVWGPARVSGQGCERYFLLVVDDYTRYTTVFPLRRKGQVPNVLIPWICAVRLQLRERFHEDLCVLRLHSDRGGEFSSELLVMEVARTSMVHAAVPHFLWPFAGPAPSIVSRVDPLPGTVPVEVTVDLGAIRGATSGGVASGGAASGGAELAPAEPWGVELAGAEPEGAEFEGAEFGGAEPGGAEPGGTEPAGADPGGAELAGAELGGAESEGAESGGAKPRGTASSGGPAGSAAGGTGAGGAGATCFGGARVPPGSGSTGGVGAAGLGGARTRGIGAAGAGGFGGAGAGGAGAGDPSAGGAGAGGTGDRGAGAKDRGARGAGAGGTGAGGAGAGGAGAGGNGAGGA
ncbi:unnamed protein product [Closterium sp. NIES-54]